MATTRRDRPRRRHSLDSIAPLYDARYEHDACGVGFVADAGGRSRDRVLPLALAGLAALGHRGAFGADGESSDGAGVALPLDRSLLALLAGESAAADRPAIVSVFLPRGRSAERRGRDVVDDCPCRGRADGRPMADRPLRCRGARRRRRGLSARVRPGDRDAPDRCGRAAAHRRRLRAPPRRRPATPRDRRPRRPGARSRTCRAVGLVPDDRLQGARHRRPAAAAVPGPAGAAVGVVRGLPPALRDEHAPGVGPRPAVPAHRPQR